MSGRNVEYLPWGAYRRDRVFKLLKDFDADILCLQEVPKCCFEDELYPMLSKMGYEGFYVQKKRGNMENYEKTGDGLAMFVKRSDFTIEKHASCDLCDIAKKEQEKLDLKTSSVNYEDCIFATHYVGLMLKLKHKESKHSLICTTTHLYWDWRAPAVRLFQMHQLLKCIQKLCPENVGNEAIPVIICGDFNSEKDTAMIHFLESASFSGNDWETFKLTNDNIWNWQKKDKIDLSLDNPFELTSAYSKKTIIPNFTASDGSWSGVLDWIFYSKSFFHVSKLLDINDETLGSIPALPNKDHPSDHLPLYAELSFA